MNKNSKLLLCAPEYYEVAYEINAWMSVRKQVDRNKAIKQWTAYYDLLKKLKVEVELIPPVKGLPDMVFTANGGLVHKQIFVRSNFRFKERRGEEPYFEKWFKKKGYLVKSIDRPFCFEGEGDALRLGKDYYTGYRFRSDIEAHDRISGILKSTYFPLELCREHFYHLDTCFCPLGDNAAMAFLPAFESYSQMILMENISDLIRIPEKEALRFAANALIVDRNAIIPEDCPQTTKELEKRGFKVHPLDFSEFIKAGGAAKCLALRM